MFFKRRITRFISKLKKIETTQLEKWIRESRIPVGVDGFLFLNILIVLFTVIRMIYNLSVGKLEVISDGLAVLFILLILLYGFIYARIKTFRDSLKTNLLEVQELFIIHMEMTPLDAIFAYAAEMVEEPLSQAFDNIAGSIQLKQDIRESISELREISPVIELVTFSFVIELFLDTGKAKESVESLAQSVKAFRYFRLEMDKKISTFKLILTAVLMIGSLGIITLIPNMIEMMNTIFTVFNT